MASGSTLKRRLRGWTKTFGTAALGNAAVGIVRLVRRMDPDRAADRAGRIMRAIGRALPEHKLARANLTAAFPEKAPDEIDHILTGAWDNLGRMAAEFAHLDKLWTADLDHPENGRIEFTPGTIDRFAQLRDDGKPALVFTAHLANWEMPAVAAAAHGIESAALYRRPNIGRIDELVKDLRAVNMGTLVPTSLDAPVKLLKLLEQGIHVGMLVDQYYTRGVDIEFFGRTTRANPLLARLAQHVDCPIHGVRIIRLPGHRFRADLTEAVPPVRSDDGRVDIAATTQAINSVIEGWVREHPEQWLWMHRRWR
ncbi:MAG TPA: lipid A biosynthesis lauroyl acyltransferase [Xanthobacteraceae bacterium]|nr:lipid A biosynthesis lauroyl acyltransferase [Xanthobacteraceae bacterium]